MARPLRIEYDGALYHVTSRGNERKAIFRDAADRESFLATLFQVAGRFHWICHAYCLMNNHYHLVIETPDGNLSKGMRQLNGVYTQAFNRRRELMGINSEAIMAAVGKYYGIKPEEMKGRGQRYTEPRYVASYLMRRHGLLGLREIDERVGLHLSAVGNAVQRVTERPTRTMAKSVKELESKFKNQES